GGRARGRPPNAWCYGDPGIATALWSAAVRCDEPVAEWQDLAIAAAARPVLACAVEVAGLWHGAIGLAHLFNRCFQASGHPALRDASRTWFARGLELRRPGEGIAGFVTHRGGVGSTVGWVASSDFIEGAAGIGLALLAGIGAREPGWDRLLACD